MKKYFLFSTTEYDEWECLQTRKSLSQITKRLAVIQSEAHFSDCKSVSDDDMVWELRWKNGRRIYYSIIKDTNMVLLLGGNKNGQEKDIKRAQSILAASLSERRKTLRPYGKTA